jgi:Fe-S oxidoreductase
LIDNLKKLGFNPVELQTGCCGMAGSFGYHKNNYDVSIKVGEQVLFPALNELPDDAIICSPGFSCRHQIADGVERKGYHPAVVVDRFMK